MAYNLSFTKKWHVNVFLGMLVFLSMMTTTIMDVEIRWSNAEIIMAYALPILCLFGLLHMILQKDYYFHLTFLDLLIIIWCLYYFCRTWVGGEYPCGTQFLKDCCLFVLYFVARILFSSPTISPIYIAILLFMFGCLEALLGLKQMITGDSRHYLYMLTGSFLNPGPYSAYLLLALVTGLTVKNDFFSLIRISSTKWHPYITGAYYLILALMTVILSSTWSRAALLSLALYCLWYYRKEYWQWRYVVWSMCLVTVLGAYFVKQTSADGRILTWIASLTTWLHSPWFGVGIGGFRHACAEGIAELYTAYPDNPLFHFGDVAEYAFCDILKILTEQGIIGVVLCLSIVGLILYQVYYYSKPLYYGMLSLVIFSLFSYPFELYPYRIIVAMIAAVSPTKIHLAAIYGRKKSMLIIPIGIVFIIISIFMTSEIQIRRNTDQKIALFIDAQHASSINDFYKLLPKENDNPRFVFAFAKALRNADRYNESNACLSEGTSISNDPMFYLLQGNNYKDLGVFGLAERSYLKAYAVMPNRLYPLYQLMKLYEHMGYKEKMRYMAKRIIESNPKIISPATEAMKNQAKTAL